MKAPLEPALPGDQVLSLRDGRVLGYTQTGNPTDRPVFFFHGSPGSRLQRHPNETIASGLGVRLISIDRPGYGLSDFQPDRTLLDWPADVAQLADALHIERFAAIGLSGGAPYLLACAHQLPQRLTSAIVISGMGPLSEPEVLEGMMPAVQLGLALVQRVPWWLLCLLLEPSVKLIRLDPLVAKKVLPASFPEADQAIFAWRDLQALDREDLGQAYRQGGRAFGWDLVLLTRPWGFRLQDIPLTIHLWHGEEDTTIPVAMGRYLACILPACEPLISIEKIGESDPVPFRSAGQPLAVVRCLQATKVIAGTVVGRTLAEHGADVLHIAGPREEEHFLNWYETGIGGTCQDGESDTKEMNCSTLFSEGKKDQARHKCDNACNLIPGQTFMVDDDAEQDDDQ